MKKWNINSRKIFIQARIQLVLNYLVLNWNKTKKKYSFKEDASFVDGLKVYKYLYLIDQQKKHLCLSGRITFFSLWTLDSNLWLNRSKLIESLYHKFFNFSIS